MTVHKHMAKSAASIVTPRRERWIAAGIIAAYLLLTVGFSLGPILEGPDELAHYQFVQFIVDNRDLPIPAHDAGWESLQPPVYYVLAASIQSLLSAADLPTIVGHVNLFHTQLDNPPLGNYNKNFRFHTAAEAFPYTGSPTALSVHILRLLSIVMGLATVVTGYGIFHELWPDRPDRRLMALAIMAFWPTAMYFAGLVNNDNAVILFSTISLLLVLQQLRYGPSWVRSIVLGAVLGLAILSKLNAAYLALPVGAAVLMDRRTWPHAGVTLCLTILVSSWWFARNMLLYGEPTGITLYYLQVPLARVQPGTLTFAHWADEMIYSYTIAWGRFGSRSIPISDAYLRLFDLLVIVALAGGTVAVVRFVRAKRNLAAVSFRQWIVVGLFAIAWAMAIGTYIAVERGGVYGHLLLPGLAAYAALLAAGQDVWTSARLRWRTTLSVLCATLLITMVCLFGYFRFAYEPLGPPSRIENPITYRYADVAELIGSDASEYRAQPGGRVFVTLYWRALKPAENSLLTYLSSTNSDLVRRTSIPGTGNLSPSDWQPGQVWAERFPISLPINAEVQRVYALEAGLLDGQENGPLPVADAAGAEVSAPIFGRLIVSGPPQNLNADYTFGGIIGLTEPTVTRQGHNLTVCFEWLSIKPTPTDYQIFVHVVNSSGALVTQADVQPKSGQYPTSAWSPGEAIKDCVSLNLGPASAAGLHLAVGVYDLTTGARLEVVNKSGLTLPDGQLVLHP